MMGSGPCSQEWLELGLGLIKTTKKQTEKQLMLGSDRRHHQIHLDQDEKEECLDLRLQIGPYNKINNHIVEINRNTTTAPHFHANSSFWFSLRTSPNRKSGAALPQIPKPYIRVKDEKMTVLMVKKYLLTKLSLSSEAEVELWCMGERLNEGQSLKEVRDGVWLPKLVEFMNSSFSTNSLLYHQQHSNQLFSLFSTTYLMSLYYGTIT